MKIMLALILQTNWAAMKTSRGDLENIYRLWRDLKFVCNDGDCDSA